MVCGWACFIPIGSVSLGWQVLRRLLASRDILARESGVVREKEWPIRTVLLPGVPGGESGPSLWRRDWLGKDECKRRCCRHGVKTRLKKETDR